MRSSTRGGAFARAVLFISAGAAVGCANTVVPSYTEIKSVRNVAILALDGDVNVDFDDEPGRSHGMSRTFSPARPTPEQEVTARRAREAEAVFSAARDAFARGPGWALVRPTPTPAWMAGFAKNASPALLDESPREIHLVGLPYAQRIVIGNDDVDGAGSKVIRPPLRDVAHQLGVEAFALVTFEVTRHSWTSHGPILTPDPDSSASDGRLAPVAEMRVLIVDPQGRVLARVYGQAAARTCGLPLATEDSEDEVCPIVEATSAALEAAVQRIGK
jgi:hypothetical protein